MMIVRNLVSPGSAGGATSASACRLSRARNTRRVWARPGTAGSRSGHKFSTDLAFLPSMVPAGVLFAGVLWLRKEQHRRHPFP